MTDKQKDIERLIAELSGAIISVFEAAHEGSNFPGCDNCSLIEYCESHGLYCGNAVNGLLVGQEWEPKVAAS